MELIWWIDHLGVGGSQKRLIQLVTALSSHVPQQAIVCLNSVVQPDTRELLNTCGVEIRVLGKWKLLTGVGVISTWWWLRRKPTYTSITFLFFSDVIGILLSRMTGAKKIISSQVGRNSHYSPSQEWILKKILTLTQSVVLNAKCLRKSLQRYLPIDANIKIIRNGINLDDPLIGNNDIGIRQSLGVSADTKLIGSIGRLAPEKSLATLICALSRIDRSDIHVVLVGTGDQRALLENLAVRLGIDHRVHFLGYRSNVYEVLKQIDVYVQASLYEGMPNAVMEAMAVACPVIATSVDGNVELIGDEHCGWLFKPHDSCALAGCINSVLDNPRESAIRSTRATNRLLTDYTEQQMIIKWKTLLELSSP